VRGLLSIVSWVISVFLLRLYASCYLGFLHPFAILVLFYPAKIILKQHTCLPLVLYETRCTRLMP
jgi:hypothetical protein